MKVAICVKQVPKPGDVYVDDRGEVAEKTGVSILNPFDGFAIEEALRIKEKNGAHLLAVTLSEMSENHVIREALEYGVDEGLILYDKKFQGIDAVAAGGIMARALHQIGDVDLILTGCKSIDFGSGIFGGILGDELGIPWFSDVGKLEILERGFLLETAWADSTQLIEVHGPVVLSLSDGMNEPRMKTVKGMIKAAQAEIPIWDAEMLELEADLFVKKSETIEIRRK